jgi:lycopene cyclase CruP
MCVCVCVCVCVYDTYEPATHTHILNTCEAGIQTAELEALIELGVLSEAELKSAIITDYSPQRVGFSPGGVGYVLASINGVLNLGVDPLSLIAMVKEAFLKAGGVLLEEHAFNQAQVTSRMLTYARGARFQPSTGHLTYAHVC